MPPPPPPPPSAGPPRGLRPPTKAAGGTVDRGALLSSIQSGKVLKKTVTNDRSSPLIDGKATKTSISSSNGAIHGPGGGGGGGGGMVNGGAPQLAGLFAGGMPKLRPTGRGRTESSGTSNANFGGFRPPIGGIGGGGGPMIPMGKKASAPPTPPGSAKPTPPSQPHVNHHIPSPHNENQLQNNGSSLPPSPKPSSKSNPAPPPPPSNRKPSVPDRGFGPRLPHLEIPPPTSRSYTPRPSVDSSSSQSEERQNPPLPAKPSFKVRPEPGYRGAPPRPPSSSKPNPSTKSTDLKASEEPRRPSIDRSVSMREPFRPPPPQMRVGTSAESPAAPFRVQNNHREAPPIPNPRPQLSKTVGRAAGSKVVLGLRPPTDKPPKPPQRPVVVAPPPPSQPPPPPPSHRVGTSPAVTPTPSPGGKADVPLPPIPHTTVPPPPPERNESTRTSNNRQSGDFESKYLNLFKSRHQFPLPLTFNNVPKIYPSKNNGKNQRRAPQPPTSSSQQQQQMRQQPNSVQPSLGTFTPHSTPPPLPPHAPLHLQMERKFYGTEASHC